jgi:hypothetical protein
LPDPEAASPPGSGVRKRATGTGTIDPDLKNRPGEAGAVRFLLGSKDDIPQTVGYKPPILSPLCFAPIF